MTDVSSLVSFPFVSMCQIDGLEGIENLAMTGTSIREISQKKREGEEKNSPSPVRHGLTISQF